MGKRKRRLREVTLSELDALRHSDSAAYDAVVQMVRVFAELKDKPAR